MQYLAMLTMLIDHIGVVFFPDNPIWRIIGRIAFPIYAFAIVTGLAHTRDKRRYVKRLAIIAAIAQIPYMAALGTLQINVIGTFLAVIGTLALIDRTRHPAAIAGLLLGAAVVLEAVPFSYGSYALVLIYIYRSLAGRPHAMVAAHFLLNIAYAAWTGGVWQLASLLPTFLIAYAPGFAAKRHAPRWLWLSFYPGHLMVLFAIEAWFLFQQ